MPRVRKKLAQLPRVPELHCSTNPDAVGGEKQRGGELRPENAFGLMGDRGVAPSFIWPVNVPGGDGKRRQDEAVKVQEFAGRMSQRLVMALTFPGG